MCFQLGRRCRRKLFSSRERDFERDLELSAGGRRTHVQAVPLPSAARLPRRAFPHKRGLRETSFRPLPTRTRSRFLPRAFLFCGVWRRIAVAGRRLARRITQRHAVAIVIRPETTVTGASSFSKNSNMVASPYFPDGRQNVRPFTDPPQTKQAAPERVRNGMSPERTPSAPTREAFRFRSLRTETGHDRVSLPKGTIRLPARSRNPSDVSRALARRFRWNAENEAPHPSSDAGSCAAFGAATGKGSAFRNTVCLRNSRSPDSRSRPARSRMSVAALTSSASRRGSWTDLLVFMGIPVVVLLVMG